MSKRVQWIAANGREEATINGFTLVRLPRRAYRFARVDRYGGLVTYSTLRELLASV